MNLKNIQNNNKHFEILVFNYNQQSSKIYKLED